ncbi:MAG: nucleotidyltransferase domain-containing protein [Ruminococcus sp.]|nr:nucleotidyltransferase domain-containing protein [Candidatus Copronaster equi]
MLDYLQIENCIKTLLRKYNAESALIFGSYARNEANLNSDIDVIVFGGKLFNKCDIFSFADDLFEMTGKNVDVFEISEVNPGTPFYENVMREGRKIA